MYRRALLTTIVLPLAGCSFAPSDPSTNSYPFSGPNIFASFDWDSSRNTLTVVFERGNRVTPENTGQLSVLTPNADDAETVWVDGDSTNSYSTFPVVPGDVLTHEIPEPATTRLLWIHPEQHTSRVVEIWEPETESEGSR